MPAISRPLNVIVFAKSLRKVRTPSATKISRSCSVGSPSSLFPCTCQVTRALVPSGRILVPLISILPTFLPTRRSRTAKGIAARFSSSTERFINDCLGVSFPLPEDVVIAFSFCFVQRCRFPAPLFYCQTHEFSGIYCQTHTFITIHRQSQSLSIHWFPNPYNMTTPLDSLEIIDSKTNRESVLRRNPYVLTIKPMGSIIKPRKMMKTHETVSGRP